MSDYQNRAASFLQEYIALVERFGVRLYSSEAMACDGEIGTVDTRNNPGRYEPVLGEEDVMVWRGE